MSGQSACALLMIRSDSQLSFPRTAVSGPLQLRAAAHGLLPFLQGLDVIGQIEDALLDDILVMWDQR